MKRRDLERRLRIAGCYLKGSNSSRISPRRLAHCPGIVTFVPSSCGHIDMAEGIEYDIPVRELERNMLRKIITGARGLLIQKQTVSVSWFVQTV